MSTSTVGSYPLRSERVCGDRLIHALFHHVHVLRRKPEPASPHSHSHVRVSCLVLFSGNKEETNTVCGLVFCIAGMSKIVSVLPFDLL